MLNLMLKCNTLFFFFFEQGTDKLHMDRSDQNRAKRDKVSWKEGAQRDFEAVVTVIIYHGLGTLLPERWDPDKRSLRYRH